MLPSRVLTLCAALVAMVYAATHSWLGYHLCLNDFWGWSFLASRMDLAHPSTLYNGFMPVGYALFLKVLGPGAEIPGAFVLNVVAVFLALAAIAAVSERVSGGWAALVSILLAGLFTPLFESGLTAGPDIVVGALFALAVARVLPQRSVSVGQGVVAGLLVAAAMLVRTHALFAGVGLLFALIVDHRRIDAGILGLAGGIAVGVLIQVGINLAAGQSVWANSQIFNVYKMVHSVDWYSPVVPEGLTLTGIIQDSPRLFLRHWAGSFVRSGFWLSGPAVAWVVGRMCGDRAVERLSMLGLIAGLIYTIPVSLGGSPRTAVVTSIWVIPVVAASILDLRLDRASVPRFGMAIALAAGLVVGLQADQRFLRRNRHEFKNFQTIEYILSSRGANRAREVFSNDFDLYFRELDGHRPYTLGGWGVIGIDGWTDEWPPLPTDTRAHFLAVCRERGVHYLALTRKIRRLGPELSTLFYRPHTLEAEGVHDLARVGDFVLVVIDPVLPSDPRPTNGIAP